MTEAELKAAKERFAERLAEPIPRAKPKPKPEPEAEVVPFNPFPWGRRRWTAEPVGTTSYRAWEPTGLDRLAEVQRAVASAARQSRASRDPFGIGHWGHETMDDLIRRQNGDD
jgi:hypothetical protein